LEFKILLFLQIEISIFLVVQFGCPAGMLDFKYTVWTWIIGTVDVSNHPWIPLFHWLQLRTYRTKSLIQSHLPQISLSTDDLYESRHPWYLKPVGSGKYGANSGLSEWKTLPGKNPKKHLDKQPSWSKF